MHNNYIWNRNDWEEYVSEQCKYTLKEFIMAFCKDAHFRHNILAVMGTDVERLKDSVKYFGG